MTVAEIAAQMGVAPETLVQEVIAQGMTKATVFVVLGVLAAVLAAAVPFVGAYLGGEFSVPTFMLLILISVILLLKVPDLIAWKTAPEATARQYIVEHYVEHYGGTENDD